MAISVEEIEKAGYVIHKNGSLTKDGKVANQYIIQGRVNVEVFLPRQEGKAKPWTYVRLHRMVAMKYVPNPHNYKHIAFKRGGSCRWSNLTWVSPQDPGSVRTEKARLRREGIVLLELGEISWTTAWKKYGLNRTTAYNIWRQVNATL